MYPTNVEEVHQTIKDLKNNSSPGTDTITKQNILHISDIIGGILANLINYVLSSGIFPEELKISKIIPIYKGGQHSDIGNYRPITISNTFSKIVEKIIKTRIVKYIQQTFKFDSYQYGFQKKSSTLDTNVDFLEYITTELDKKKHVAVVFIDLKKAFDTVNIELMLDKMHKMGIRGVAYQLMKSYSTGRQQFTVVNGSSSSKSVINVGVPQGSVLGPVEYLMYVHSLKYVGLRARYFMFADDTALVYSAAELLDLETAVNYDLDIYYKWLCRNKLTINVKKTVYMLIKQKNKVDGDLALVINGANIQRVKNYKYLGLEITSDLTWDSHINSIIKKIVPMVGAIRRCSGYLNNNSRALLYNSFVETHLRYLIPCWGNAAKHLLNKLQRVQNKAIKVIYSIEYYTPTIEIYKQTNKMNIRNLKILEQVKIIHNIKTKQIKINSALKQARDYHKHDTRRKNNLRNEYVRTKKAQDSPIYRSIQAYNSVPEDVINTQTVSNLCNKLKLHLKSI